MASQKKFPPQGWKTRRVFIAVIALLAVAMLLGVAGGPVLVEGETDPRPFAAVLSAATYIALIGVIGWFVWKIVGGRR